MFCFQTYDNLLAAEVKNSREKLTSLQIKVGDRFLSIFDYRLTNSQILLE
jgi:hypothetical protein